VSNIIKIPFFGIARQYETLREELLDASDRVYCTGQVLDGDYTKFFERQIARRCNRQYAVAVNSCTQGLIFAMQAGLTPESRVIVPGISFAATINSVLMANAVPVFCDVDQNALIDLESIDYALDGAGVSGIMYANLFGNVVDYDRFRTYTEFFNEDLFIIEDAAQSFGASYKGIPSGKLGDVSVLSFDPTKNLPNYGSGGMILTDNFDLAEACYDLRNNGKLDGHSHPGTNSKMSESDCAQMLVKLKHFDVWQRRRKEIADYYIGELAEFVDVCMPGPDVDPAWHKFVIRLTERHGLAQHLAVDGIETRFHYEKPLFELPVGWDYIDYAHVQYRESTAFSRECMSLPIYPEMTDSEVTQVIESIERFLR
jgi:dTDP-4-amino-4,6-dideoxygalactose transaminase